MKKKIKKELSDNLRPEYDLSKLKGRVRGKYAKQFKESLKQGDNPRLIHKKLGKNH